MEQAYGIFNREKSQSLAPPLPGRASRRTTITRGSASGREEEGDTRRRKFSETFPLPGSRGKITYIEVHAR